MINPGSKEANSSHPNITHSTFLHPYINDADTLIDWGLTKLGGGEGGLQTVELTRKMCEICVADALEKYAKYASFPIEDIIVPLEGYDKELGLDLSEYNIADIHDISFQRDSIYAMFGQDMFFGQYGMMQSYAASGIFPFAGSLGMNNGCWVSVHNLREHLEMIHRLTGSCPQWRYFQNSKRLKITPAPRHTHRPSDVILLTAEREPPAEELYGNEYVKRLFLAYLKIQLGVVRKKFSSVQLIGGGQIDTSIGEEGQQELDKALEELRSSESFSNLCFVG